MSNTMRPGNSPNKPVGAPDKEERLFTVELWSKIFGCLSKHSVFSVVRCLFPRKLGGHLFPELWATGHLVASGVLAAVCSVPGLALWELIFIIYAGLRIFELVVYQINILFAPYRAEKKNKQALLGGFERSIILVIYNYAEVIFWFTFIYRNVRGAFGIDSPLVPNLESFFGALNHSFHAMSSFGYSSAVPIKWPGTALVIIQGCIGLFMMIFILAGLIALLPRRPIALLPTLHKSKPEDEANIEDKSVG